VDDGQQRASGKNLPFALTRFLSLVSLVLILVLSLGLALFIGRTANRTLLSRQQQYSQLMAENLNQQIYRRFTVPTWLTFGRIALQHPAQYERLDEVVRSSIVGQNIDSLRIFDPIKVIGYSLDREELGRTDIFVPGLDVVYEHSRPVYEIVSPMPLWRAFFSFTLPEKSFMLHTVYPLSVDLTFRRQISIPGDEAPLLGVLELTQDITQDYATVIRFQWIILLTCIGSSLVMFAILQFFIVKAESILYERMQRNRRLEAELHQNEKLASMGRVIASIAHEIRNPLGIIRSSSELLLRRAAEDDPFRRIQKAIFDESCRLSQTVNDFLDYARPRPPRYAPVDLGQIIDQACGFLEGEFSRLGVGLDQQREGDLTVVGDKDLLYRALYNVLSNALQALSGKGEIRILARGDVEGVSISIRDSGPGFSETNMDKILDPFFTTKDNGTGLGLPIVNTIVTSHGGRLFLDNAEQGGARVTISLPRRHEDSP
jgi:signal transduction histidine kinase